MKTPIENQGIIKKFKIGLGVCRILKNPSIFFLDYLNLTNNPYLVYNFKNGIKLKLRHDTTDRNLINELYLEKTYTKYFNIKNGEVVIDIGANIGAFTVLAGKMAKNGKVFAIEPFSENFRLLEENVRLNNLSNVTLINKAITNKTGEQEIYIPKRAFGGVSLSDKHWQLRGDFRKEKIRTTSLREIIKSNKIGRIDFLKIDCEGSEYDILMGLTGKELQKISKMVIEFHRFDESNKVFELLSFLLRNGFKIETEGLDYPVGTIYAFRKD